MNHVRRDNYYCSYSQAARYGRDPNVVCLHNERHGNGQQENAEVKAEVAAEEFAELPCYGLSVTIEKNEDYDQSYEDS